MESEATAGAEAAGDIEAILDSQVTERFEGHVERALAQRRSGNMPGAIEEFAAACRLRPAEVGARCELALTHLEAGHLEEARTLYRSVHDGDAGSLPALIGLAQISRRRREFAESIAYFEKAIDIDPTRLDIPMDLAEVLSEAGRAEAARTVLRAVLARDASNWRALVGLGLLARQRGDAAAAAALFRAASDANPEHIGIQLELGLSQRSAGLLNAAADTYRSVLLREPKQVDALVGLATVLRPLGDTGGAIGTLRAAVRERPREPGIRLEFADALRANAQLAEADREYETLLALDADQWPAWAGRAMVARQRGDHPAAIEHLQAALALRPGELALRYELAFTLRLAERLSDAEALYAQLKEADPKSGEPLQGMSAIAGARGDLESAIRLARSAAEREPERIERQVFLAGVLRDAGRLEDAAALVDQCLALMPEHGGAWFERGLQARARNDRAAALNAFLRFSATDPANGFCEAAVEELALGRPHEARSAYQRALTHHPAHFRATLGLAEIEMLAANYSQCLALCDALIGLYPRQIAALRLKCRALMALGRDEEALRVVELLDTGPTALEADAARLEMFRSGGRRLEAHALLSRPRVALATGFGLWYEKLLTRLAFNELAAVSVALQSAPAVRPFERSRVLHGRATLADLDWRIEEAISGFLQVLELHADDPDTHLQLARLYFLHSDADRAREHVQAMIAKSRSARLMRGESMKVSQTVIGQLVNELELDAELRDELVALRDLKPEARVDCVAELVRRAPQVTPPAIALVLALRQAGALKIWDMPGANAAAIPRKIMQYAHSARPADGTQRLMSSWVEAHPGYLYCRFDDEAARDYLFAHHPREVFDAYDHAPNPERASHLFRLAYLVKEGGFYVDAEYRCVGPLASVTTPDAVLIAHQEPFATLGNGFLGCAPGEAVMARAFTLAVECLNRGDSDAEWLATGRGLMTRAFAEVFAAQGADWRVWLSPRRILDRQALSKVAWPQAIAGKKKPRGGR